MQNYDNDTIGQHCFMKKYTKNLLKINFLSEQNVSIITDYILHKRIKNKCLVQKKMSYLCSEIRKQMKIWFDAKSEYLVEQKLTNIKRLNKYFIKDNKFLYNVYAHSDEHGYSYYDIEPLKNKVDVNYTYNNELINLRVPPKRVNGMDLPNMDFKSNKDNVSQGMYIKTYKFIPGTRTSYLSNIYDRSNESLKDQDGFGRSIVNGDIRPLI